MKANLKWRYPLTPLNLNIVDSIALHHMANDTADIDTIHGWHLARDPDKNGVGTWEGFGYNYWIDFDGTIFECRGLNRACGVGGKNGHIISVGFRGNYHYHATAKYRTSMPDAQYNAGVWLINYLKGLVPTVKNVGGHKDFSATACPGQYFPLAEMKKGGYRNMSIQYQIYKVVSGDTLSHIAVRYNTTVANLQAINGLGSSTLIRVGDELKVPAPATNVSNAEVEKLKNTIKQLETDLAKEQAARLTAQNALNKANTDLAAANSKNTKYQQYFKLQKELGGM